MKSVFRQFTDFDEYEATIRGAQMTGYVAERGVFAAEVQQLDLERLWLQRGHESLPRTAHLDIPENRSPVFFLGSRMKHPVLQSGQEIKPGQLVFWGKEAAHYQRIETEMDWAAMSLSPADLAEIGAHLTGNEIAAPKLSQIFTPPSDAMARLVGLHEATTKLARDKPERLSHFEVEKAISHALIEAMVNCLSELNPLEAGRSWHQHLRIMRRFEDWLTSNLGKPVYLAEACAQLGVSQRTLNQCCQEHVGMSPSHYLWLRRMHQAHRALLHSPTEKVTVAEIAMEFGFWELGRFSVSYRRIFGESPKQTLRR